MSAIRASRPDRPVELQLGRSTPLLATEPLGDVTVAFAPVARNDRVHMRRSRKDLATWGLDPPRGARQVGAASRTLVRFVVLTGDIHRTTWTPPRPGQEESPDPVRRKGRQPQVVKTSRQVA